MKTGGYMFETVWGADGLRVYLHTSDLSPTMIGDAAGLVLFRMLDGSLARVPLQRESPARGESPVVYFCTMHPDVLQLEAGYCRRCGMSLSPQDRLFAPVDLAALKAGSVTTVTITGLEGEKDGSLNFEQTVPGIATPASGDQASVSGEHHHAAP